MAFENFQELLIDGPADRQLEDGELYRLLSPVGFADLQAAGRCLERIAAEPLLRTVLPDILSPLLVTLSDAASPDRALVNFERFVQSANYAPELFESLANTPRAIEILVTLFAGSQYLTEILLANPGYFELLAEHRRLAQSRSAGQFYTEAQSYLSSGQTFPQQIDALRRFQRRELLRIGACDLLDFFDLPAVTQQLSNLADGLVRACLQIASESLSISTGGFAVLAMGKLGGRELNYSSDIDLLFIGKGDTEKYRPLGEKLIQALSKVTGEGFLYRVDMRLRPWGRVGALVPSLDGYMAYLGQHARLWEKQALLKARVIAGDGSLGDKFLAGAQPFIFASIPDTLQADVFAMKQRTEDHLRQLGRLWGEVKLGEGSIRDIEFITQYLQLAHGGRLTEVIDTNTLKSLEKLFAQQLLTANDYRVLADGYIFLRTIEHHLQMMHYQQTNQLPRDPEALAQLARRLRFIGPEAGNYFVLRYQQHCSAIRAVYLRQFGNDGQQASGEMPAPAATPDIPHHLLRMDPSYAVTFSPEDIARHAALAERLDDDHLVEVQAQPLEGERWQITIVAYDYPGELSLICGLLFVYNLNILEGHVFTYEPPRASPAARPQGLRPKIVDVFTVRSMNGDPSPDTWRRYRADLAALLRLMHTGKRREARAELAKRVALTVAEIPGEATKLYPIDIEIDNSASGRYTVLKIEARDTPGFLYELANALAFHRVYIAQVTVDSLGSRLHDTLYVTDSERQKITAPDKQRELRAAIVLIKHFTHLLPHSPNPESALSHFREFVEQLFTHPGWPDELTSLERPEVLGALAKLLGVSDFLWDDFLRMQYANLFPVVRDVDALASSKSRQQLQAELETVISMDRQAWRAGLNAFKDRELFRVDMRNILGYTLEFEQFSRELTDLAEVVVEAAYRGCFEELVAEYGMPTLESGRVCPMTVCALGKCGGRELGFASDIELIFIYAGNGQTEGPKQISLAEFYEKLVENFLSTVQARREGIFQVDLQLRPYGKAGSLAVSLEAFRRYYAPEGPAWAYERQALVRLRPLVGDMELGKQIVAYRDEFVYNGDPFDVTTMRAMRERQIRHLVTAGTFNAKFSLGGLLDVEYLVQGLQINHGRDNPSLRSTNTREALAALAASGIISQDVYTRLRKAHTFLRWLIDSLRVVRGNAKDMTVPPANGDEFAFLARRLRYGKDIDRLQDELIRYTRDVQELNYQLLG